EAYEIKPRYTTRHTECLPGEIAFRQPSSDGIMARYQARDRDIFVLRRTTSGVIVELVRGGDQAGNAARWATRQANTITRVHRAEKRAVFDADYFRSRSRCQ